MLKSYFIILLSETDKSHKLGHENKDNAIGTGLDDNDLVCSLCMKQFSTMRSLKHHKRTVHMPPKFHCQICDKKFTEKPTLKKHLKNVHKMACCFHCFDIYPLDRGYAHVCKI